VFLQNYQAPAIFYIYRIIFLLKIPWNRSAVRWTESMVAGARVHRLSLNESRRLADQWLRLKKCEGVSNNLIVVVNAGMDGSRWLGWQGWRDHGGAPGPRRWLAGVKHYQCSGPPNSTRFSPMASWRRGELNSLTLGRQRTAVAASDGEAVWLGAGVNIGKLRCSSSEDEGTKGGGGLWRSFQDGWFGTGGSTPVQRQALHDGWGLDYCGSKFTVEQALYIGLFAPNHRQQRF
jgi:hypothetical protein